MDDSRKKMRFYIVDAFADQPFGGNTAGVVLLDGDTFPEESLMVQVAAELRYSETAFVHRLSLAEYHIRYFTPRSEVDLCGHATVASFALLHRLGEAEGRCQCRTLAGVLEIEVGERVMMQMACPQIVGTLSETDDIYSALNLADQRPTLPVQVVYAGLPDIMIPVSDVTTLNTLRPDMQRIASLTEAHNAVSFHVFALGNDGFTAHVRDFAPLYGIDEESATGTANASLTHYLAAHGVVPARGEFAFLQGEAMGRASVVATRIDGEGRIYVGGTAAVVAEGLLTV